MDKVLFTLSKCFKVYIQCILNCIFCFAGNQNTYASRKMNFVDEQRFAFAICILCDMNINQKKVKYKAKASLDQGLVALLSIKQ